MSMSRMPRAVLSFVVPLAALLGVAWAGAVPGASAAEAPVLRVGLAARDLGSLDPAFTRGNVDEFVVRQVFSPLISPPMGTLRVGLDEVQGELAEKWDVSRDRRVWTFHLRKGVRWQKGYGEVTAEDVKFTFDRLRDPRVNSPYASSYEGIETVRALDPHTVQFVLKQPNPFFHVTSLMPRFGGYVVPKKAVEKLGQDFGFNPVGSGAFQFDAYQPKESVALSAFKEYFRGAPGLTGVKVFLMPETSARTLAFVGGNLDIAEGGRSPGWVTDLKSRKPDAIFDALRPGSTQTLFLNMTVKPFGDVRVRRAIAHALDRSVWQQALGILSGPMWGPAPGEFYGGLGEKDVPEDLRYRYDPTRAKALLAEAGFPNGFQVNAYISEREDYKTNMLLIQDQLRKVGITINLRVVDHTTYHADNDKDLNSMVVYSTSQPPVVVPILQSFYHSSSIVGRPTANRNFSHYGEVGGSIDETLEKAISEPAARKQLELLREVQRQILRDAAGIPLQTLAVLYVRQPGVDLGFTPTAGLGHYQLEKARIAK